MFGRNSTPIVVMFRSLVRVLLPLVIIGAVAAWVLSFHGSGKGQIRVTTTVPGADIFIAGWMTGYQSDTTLFDVPTGRQIITVRKPGYVSEPEVVVVDVIRGKVTTANFALRDARNLTRTDSIPPLRSVRQEIFSTGEPVTSIPPAPRRSSDRRYLDFSSQARDITGPPAVYKPDFPVNTSNSAAKLTGDTVDALVTTAPTQVTVTSVPDGALITVNGTITRHTTPYTFRGLDQGLYIFRISKPGYVSKPDSIPVTLQESEQTELVAFNLAPDQSVPKPTISITTVPAAAGIRVDGRAAGVGKAVLEVTYGSHKVEFGDAPGYRAPAQVNVEVTADNPHPEIAGTYVKIEGNSYLAVMPSEDPGIKFEGSKLRVFVDNELLLDCPKERFDASLMGKIPSGKRLVRVQYADLVEDIHVDLQDGSVSEITFRVESFFSKRKLRLRERDAVPLDKWEEKSRRLTVWTTS